MKRREFITLIGGAVALAADPPAAHAQPAERVRRIGVLMNLEAVNPEGQARSAAFQRMLQKKGWIEGRNLRIDYRWAGSDIARLRRGATELVALAPDVILATGTPSVAQLRQVTRTVPIVFVRVADPIGAGFAASLNRPDGNITGFSLFEYGLSGKWLELLRQIAPGLRRVAVLRNPDNASGIGQFAAIRAVAPSFGVELHPIDVHDAGAIERDVAAFARGQSGGLVVTSATQTVVHGGRIIALAARHRLPAIFGTVRFAHHGALVCYGPDVSDDYQRAAGYVDRILKGEKPADLPVQAPTKYRLAINLKTAKALGLTVPPALLARADQVIE